MSYEIEGIVIVKSDTVVVSEKFKKREFVIEKEENNGTQTWVDTIKFQSVQAKCDDLDNINVGDSVKVSFNLKGNKWEKDGKVSYFNNIDAWKVEKLAGNVTSESTVVDNGNQDLPF